MGKWLKYIPLLATCGMLLMPPAALAQVAGAVLDRIQVEAGAGGQEITVRLHTRMRYVSHSPRGAGDTIRIELQPVSADLSSSSGFGDRETLGWSRTTDVPLEDVIFERGSGGRAILILRFSKPVEFTVSGARDLRGVSVKVAAPPIARARPRSPVAAPIPERKDPSAAAGRFVVNLLSSLRPVGDDLAPSRQNLRGRTAYTTDFRKDGKMWHRLRVGFFGSRAEALDWLRGVSAEFPDAWVAVASGDEVRANRRAAPVRNPVASPIVVSRNKPATPDLPAGQSKEISKIMAEARRAMAGGNQARAIQLYAKVLRAPENELTRDAKEYLGLAYERNSQLAQAKGEYEEYLRLYPEGEAARRVRQRLDALITATLPGRKRLRGAKRSAGQEGDDKWRSEAYGTFSQFLFKNDTISSDGGPDISQSVLSSDIFLTGGLYSDDYEIEMRFIGGHVLNFSDGTEGEERINTFYVDLRDNRHDISARVGRQTRSTGGVLGRFDGGVVEYRPRENIGIIAVAGYPVDRSSSTGIDTDRSFYGLSLDFGPLGDHWNVNAYAIDQSVDGITDRRAVGAEVRYFDDKRMAYGLIDYDISYNDVNLALFVGNWTFEDRTTISLSLDYRRGPLLRTTNALIGQSVTEVSGLLATLTETEVRQLALDRTATSKSVSFGFSRPISKKFQVNADLTLSEMTGTVASGGVEAFPGTGTNYFMLVQLVGNGLIKKNDVGILGVRYSDTGNSEIWSLISNWRLSVTPKWRLNPRFRADYRTRSIDSSTQITARPSLRTDYRITKLGRMEVEGGIEWSNNTFAGESQNAFLYFLIAGYRWDF